MNPLTRISEVKRLMEKHGVAFQKQFGQNFLISEQVPASIAEQCGAEEEDGILEIGPGVGTLTVELARRYRKVVCIEIDRGLIPILAETLADYDNVTVINEDVMKIDLPALLAEHFAGMRVTVCANLPYYITTPILMALMEAPCRFEHITVMVQKEVAQRLCANPGEEQYGSITASVNWYGEVKRLFAVPAGCFLPAPKVDSAVVRLSLYPEPRCPVTDVEMLRRVIKGAFAQRRKTLLNSMASVFPEYGKPRLSALIERAGYAPTVRGETLGICDFAAIANVFDAESREA